MSPRWITNRTPQRRKRPVEQRPVLQLPLLTPRPEATEEDEQEAEKSQRGIAVIDFYI